MTRSDPPDYGWSCDACGYGPRRRWTDLDKCQASQILHAKTFHRNRPGYAVMSFGKVIHVVG